jgi:hypothetical protein
MLRFIGNTTVILAHELGHAVTAWTLGYLALPTFDIIYGGGVTMTSDSRSLFMLVPAISGMAFLTYKWYKKSGVPGLRVSVALWALYVLLSLTALLRHVLIVSGGHIGEIAFGSAGLYFGLSAKRFIRPNHEKIIALTLGEYLITNALRFAFSLRDSDFVSDYVASERTGDFLELSNSLGLSFSFFSVALLFIIVLAVAAVGWFLVSEAIESLGD